MCVCVLIYCFPSKFQDTYLSSWSFLSSNLKTESTLHK